MKTTVNLRGYLYVLALNLREIIGDGEGAMGGKGFSRILHGHSWSVQISARWVVLDKSGKWMRFQKMSWEKSRKN